MSFKHGKDAEVWLDGIDLSAYANSLEVSAAVDIADTTVFKNSWKTAIVGLIGGKASLKGFYDAGLTTVKDTIQAASGSILTVGPAGLAAMGDPARLLLVRDTAYGESSPVGGAIAWTADVIADGQVGFGQTLHPLGAETEDSNSSSYADLGTSATGAVAHLHVTALSSGGSITGKLQDSADHSSWSDVSSGAFSSASAVGAQRLIITGTLRRYVRVAWDVSGTTPSITFGVAAARLP